MRNKGTGSLLTRRRLLALGAGFCAAPAVAEAPKRSLRPLPRGGALPITQPEDALARLLRGLDFPGKVSAAVFDVRSGELLEAANPVLTHPPASTLKALTSYFAHRTLGDAYRFETELLCRGTLRAGVLDGDLILRGGGDPVLDSDDLLDLASRMKEAGLREVTGNFYVDDRALPRAFEIDTDQPDHVSYNPAVSGLNLNFNRVFLEWKKAREGYVLTMDARARKVRPAVSTAQISVVEKAGAVFSYQRGVKHDIWAVARRALGNEGGRWLPVRHPAIYAGDVFQTLARSHGVVLPYPKPDPGAGGDVLARFESAPLSEIARGMMRYSTNLTAEVLGLASSKRFGLSDDLRLSGACMARWYAHRFGARKSDFVDHSGLGDDARMTAVDMARALAGGDRAAVLKPLMRPVAVAAREGESRADPAIRVVAKTGTLNFVSGLAGYLTTPGGRDLAFAVFCSDLERKAALSVAERERPRGGRGWNNRARRLQRECLRHWFRSFPAER